MRRTKTMLMGELLDEFFKRPYVAAKVAEGRLPETWRAIVGDRAADETTELRLERHILQVRIRSSVLRSELFYRRDALCEELNRRTSRRGHAHRGLLCQIRRAAYLMMAARLAFWTLKRSFSSPRPW